MLPLPNLCKKESTSRHDTINLRTRLCCSIRWIVPDIDPSSIKGSSCDDDVLSQNCVSEFYFNINKVNKTGINIIRFASRVINGDGVYISEKYIHPEIENPLDFIFRKEQGGTRSSLSEYVFKATELKTYRFVDFPLGWHSDVVAVLELSQKANIFTISRLK